MKVSDVKKRVAKIKELSDTGRCTDEEAAHSEEDELQRDVLKAIAGGTCEDPAACARACLRTSKLSFARWTG